ncbi:MAG: NAD-dependent epimerase/dehydratase family protein [Nitrososphaerales archaeon]
MGESEPRAEGLPGVTAEPERIAKEAGLQIETGAGLQIVMGAGRPLGRAVLEELAAVGSRVRGVTLDAATMGGPLPDSVEIVAADPLKPGSLVKTCEGGEVIYDCFEPSHSNWKRVFREATGNILLASIDAGAELVLANHLIADERENASTESDLLNAHRSNLIRTVIARMPQIYGPGVMNTLWQDIFESAVSGKKAHWMGDPEVARSLLYVSDAASRMILLGRSLWAHGRTWNLSGPAPISGRSFIEYAYRAAGKEPKVGHWGRGVMLTGRFLSSDAKGFLELPYDYYDSFVLDGSEFMEAFPSVPYTPHEEAIAATYRWFMSRLH